ncbi:tetratricopeptide repeat-containing sensor histidine kinase [Thermoflexibacter ruber]|uniref:histidine kinase n=1 Tax=Thermoflexibacter ruber TaxID=1003 RepID=A0A1I2DVU7_9BACT|nr:tetratricopeptide repeat-containing sensor histidine kinase [Thermoflexibacter ruber]SFE84725.1 Signal transduction histidine kinase [Thermoflexibacter ruber]
MKYFFSYLFFFFIYFGSYCPTFAQNQRAIDSLETLLANPQLADTTKAKMYIDLSILYYANNLNKAIELIKESEKLSKKTNYLRGEALALHWEGIYESMQGSSEKSIHAFLQSLEISEKINYPTMKGANLARIADINREQGNYQKALELGTKGIEILRKVPEKLYLLHALHRLGTLYSDQNQFETALSYYQEGLTIAKEIKASNQISLYSFQIANVYFKQAKYKEALEYLEEGLSISQKNKNLIQQSRILNLIGEIYLKENNTKGSLEYFYKALPLAKQADATPDLKNTYWGLYQSHKKLGRIDSTLCYLEYATSLKDSLYNVEKNRMVNFFQVDAEIEKQKIELEKKQVEVENRTLLLYLGGIFIVFITLITVILFYSNQRQKKANSLLLKQKEEMFKQKQQIEKQNMSLQSLNEEISQQKEEIETLNNQLEQLVQDRTNQLKITVDNLSKQNQDLAQFSYIVSHNLRSPVARILGLINIFNENKYEDEFNKQIIAHLKQTTSELDTVIKDLTQIIAIRNSLDKTKEKINLYEVLHLTQEVLKDEIQKTNAEIIANFQIFDYIYSIKSYVQSIIYNLLSNAIKYRSEKRKPLIILKTALVGNFICLSVQDNGLGMDLSKTDTYKIFGLYQRLHDHVDGKGMGLFLVKTQVESLGGSIEVESQLDVGTTFKIYFPNNQTDTSIG